MKMLAYFTEISDFFGLFADAKKELIKDIILPCLMLSEKEKDDLVNNANEFVQSSLDSCDAQKSTT